MVGVATSSRCDNCRKRKKKCSEQRPSCIECIRAGWTCPGYKTNWKFIDETSQLAQYYAGRKYVYEVFDPNLEEVYSKSANGGMRHYSSMTVLKALPLSNSTRFKTDITYPKYGVPRHLETNSLGSKLVYCLDSKVKGILIPLRLVGSFFDFVPARLGHNAALDDAVSCLCSIYCGTLSTSYGFDKNIYQRYVRALSSLRGFLNDTSLRIKSETLCASILLQMCELVVNVDRGEWSQLARGTSFLLYSRGVHRYTSAFDYTMLESQLSYVLSQSMRLKEHCFLRSPEWQALLTHSPVWPSTASQPQALSLRSQLCGILVDLPSLIIDYSTIDEKRVSWEERDERSDFLMLKASAILDNIMKWLILEAEPLFLSYSSSRQVIQEHIDYPDILSGVLDCIANTALLTVDKMLCSLCRVRLRSNDIAGRSSLLQLKQNQLVNDPEITKRWRQRAIRAFEFVLSESILAAKPLEFGLRQIQSGGPSVFVNSEAP